MQIQLRSNIPEFRGEKILSFIEQNFERSLERFRSRIQSVQLYLEDVNGPKGGVDKVCRCVLHLKKLSPVVIRDADESWSALVQRTANRAAHSVGKAIARNRTQKRDRSKTDSEAGFRGS